MVILCFFPDVFEKWYTYWEFFHRRDIFKTHLQVLVFRFFKNVRKWHEISMGKYVFKLKIHMEKIMKMMIYMGNSDVKKVEFSWKKTCFRTWIYKWWFLCVPKTKVFAYVKWSKHFQKRLFKTNISSTLQDIFLRFWVKKRLYIVKRPKNHPKMTSQNRSPFAHRTFSFVFRA